MLAPDGSMLRRRDKNGQLRAGLSVGKQGSSVTRYDEKGKAIWSAPTAAKWKRGADHDGGGGGIRTREAPFSAYAISSRAP